MRHTHAFSLLELLIAMAIVAILSMIAYPNYQQYITRTKRLAAESSLQKLASTLDAYHLIHHTYRSAHPLIERSAGYHLAIIKLGKNSFNIAASTNRQKLVLNEKGELTYNPIER